MSSGPELSYAVLETQQCSGSGTSTPTTLESVRSWVVANKLRTVGTLWAASIAGSLLVNLRKPGEKFSVKLIHARLHAQGLTLVALLAAAGVEYWERTSRSSAPQDVPLGAAGIAHKGIQTTRWTQA